MSPFPENDVYREKTVGSLFTGIAGLDLGLERAGYRVIWQAETNPYACRVLKKHYPHVPNLGDVTQIDWSDVRRPDLVCGGFPCQPVSVAGARKGDEDDRWLWPEVARCLRVVRPKWVLLENVPGLLTLGFGQVAGDLADLGYEFRWDCLPAAAVGAPHLRYRVFLVAYADGEQLRMRTGSIPGSQGAREGQAPERQRVWADAGNGSQAVAHADSQGFAHVQGRATGTERNGHRTSDGSGWWDVEPDVARVADGVPARVDRLRCLGNAVVPQVAELVARMWLP